MTRFFFTLLLTTALQVGFAQQEWSLQRCVQYAWDNNLTVQQAELTTRNAELTTRQNQFNRLPTVNGSTSLGYQFGRTIDPTTNTFNNTRIGFNSYGINGSVTLFSGNFINNQIKQSQFNLLAAEKDAENTRQTVALNVANAYLNILLSEEQLANAQTQLELARQQLDRTDRLIGVGQLAGNARLDLEAQVARNEQLVIEAQNALDLTLLNLKQLLQLDPAQPLSLVRPDLAVAEATLVRNFTTEDVYRAALQSQPAVEAAQLRLEGNKLSEQIAESGRLPTLSLFGNLNSNYSSIAKDFNNPNTDNVMQVPGDPVTVEVGGIRQDVIFFNTVGITYPNQGFGDQLSENFGQSVGLSLSVPIYNNHRNNINAERARLNVISAELTSRQVTDQLKTDVETAITSFRAARNAYQASQRSLNAAEAAFADAERRFELGAINSFEYNNAVNNQDIARRDLTRAKYQLLFNLKVVEFYLGQPLNL